MNSEYPARFQDEHGDEETILFNDGNTLRMRIRGVEFSGRAFDDFEPEEETDASALTSFCLFRNELCHCTIVCDVPVPIVANGETITALLHIRVVLGTPDARGELDREEVHLTLHYAGKKYSGSGKSGWFEDELLEIQQALPEGVYMKMCINCAFSDYSPYGHGTFGDMLCFRANKEGYLKVRSKADYFQLHARTERVQEAYLCPEFQRRQPGTGYRG